MEDVLRIGKTSSRPIAIGETSWLGRSAFTSEGSVGRSVGWQVGSTRHSPPEAKWSAQSTQNTH